MYGELSYGDGHIPINKIHLLQFSQGHAVFKQSLIHLESSLTPTLTKSKPRDLQHHSVFTVSAACSEYSHASFLPFQTSSSITQTSPASRSLCVSAETICERKIKGQSWQLKMDPHLQGSPSLGTLERVAVWWDVLELLTLSWHNRFSWATLLMAE